MNNDYVESTLNWIKQTKLSIEMDEWAIRKNNEEIELIQKENQIREVSLAKSKDWIKIVEKEMADHIELTKSL